MSRFQKILEKERQKLNQLGAESLRQSIPLAENPKVQKQSRIVDELVAQYQQRKAKRRHTVR
ncbi:aspartyl-phosphate phosphatase Spo0E family protein [Paenibacillus sp. BR1-192]|jgi:hypothetical protein|uniref:aspartyl-phosphate phosphatase Spo0E family protein n=1 Tax=Paenibacillus sp. BR1-192 TaxID=3032287 RepID=UPI00240DE017|nr:aspartyl-phosphate phosphatase Spo0E family protein [Paenibacillus sp. BR1-192]WFB59603.1 aspartyl-phosphate phosphatase Spo0E family protein [Paenibacillus sp. BR1-192]